MNLHKANGFTRHEILTAIKLNGAMTADLLGKELGISPVAVRQHLASLEAEGLVATSIERRGVGRPVHRYTITQRGDETFPRHYDSLANALLDELRASEGEDAVERLFARRRERLVAALRMRMEGKSLDERVEELAQIQTEAGFMAECAEDDEGYVLIEHNCAACAVAKAHRAVCRQEMAMFQDLLGDEAEIERITHIASGDFTCTYRIRQKAGKK